MNSSKLLVTSAAALLLSASFGLSAPLTVLNFSFENPNVGNSYGGPADNWSGAFVETAPGVGFTTGYEGNQYAGQDGATITQNLNVPFAANSTYTITLAVGNRASFAEGLTQFGLQSSDNAGFDLGTPTTVNNDTDVALSTFADFTYTFSTGALAPTGNIVVFWRGLADNVDGNRADVDNYRIDVIPEPASVGLLGLGAIGLLARRRRA